MIHWFWTTPRLPRNDHANLNQAEHSRRTVTGNLWKCVILSRSLTTTSESHFSHRPSCSPVRCSPTIPTLGALLCLCS